MTARLASPTLNQATQSLGCSPQPYVVVIFGRTGVGVSSLVNLILGHPASNAHPNAKTTSQQVKPHPVTLGSNRKLCLYEVPGFGGKLSDATILKMIHAIERDKGIDLFLYCFRKQKKTVIHHIVRLIRDSFLVPMIAVVTELEREPEGVDAWWDVPLGDGTHTNGSLVERMCFDGRDGFEAHVCITTLSLREVDLLEGLRKKRERSQERIRKLILEHCSGPKRRGSESDLRLPCSCLSFLYGICGIRI